MPYKLSDDGLTVLKDDGSEVPGGRHKNRRQALAHLRALMVNVDKSADLEALAAKFGARNSSPDLERLQRIHDLAVENGAECGGGKSLNLAYAKSLGLGSLPDLAVKSLGGDEITGYIALWGNPALLDLDGDFFTRDTDFWPDKIGFPRPLTWEHGQDGAFKARAVVGSIDSLSEDDLGLVYHAALDRNSKYRKVIDKLIADGALGTSSDSAPQYVIREQRGKGAWLKQWPLFSGALTASPAEPRMLDTVHFKTFGVELPGQAAPDGASVEVLKLHHRFLSLIERTI